MNVVLALLPWIALFGIAVGIAIVAYAERKAFAREMDEAEAERKALEAMLVRYGLIDEHGNPLDKNGNPLPRAMFEGKRITD